jgi:crotonobetainyl-CoA:carnitine CoA-transferase CaiB-like acyl-CoA transferase
MLGRACGEARFLSAGEAALGVLLALLGRETSGRGNLVDVSLHECLRSARAHAGEAIASRDGSEGERDIQGRAPRIGEHNRDVLRESGFGEAEIARLVADGVI